MGLLDMQGAQSAQPQGGLLGGYQPQAQGAQPQQGGMPPGMMEAVKQIKMADPEAQQKMVQDVVQKIQSSGKPPELIKQVLGQFMQAMQS